MKIRDLTDFFSTRQNNFKHYLNQIKTNLQQSSSKQHNLKLINQPTSFTPATNTNLLKFIICEQLTTITQHLNNNLIIQFTKRTRLKQQKGRTKFDQLPQIIKQQYNSFGRKILQWLTSEFTSAKINKIIVDRLPEHKTKQQVNLRITFYHQNHPRDLNLKVTPQIDNLKTVKLKQLIDRLQAINGINLNLSSNPKNPTDILPQLKTSLNQINNKQTVQKLFKCLIGFKPYYLIIAEPKPLIADFTKHKMPTSLQVEYKHNQFTIHFDNDYHLTTEIKMDQQEPYLEIDFQTLPNELELLSF